MARKPKKGEFKIVPHTSEMAVAVRGETWEQFFQSAAEGLISLYAAAGAPRASQRRGLRLKADSAEELLIAWLNELIYLVGGQHWLPTSVRVTQAEPNELTAELEGAPLDGVKLGREIKAATFGGLHLKKDGNAWTAVVILDV